MKCFIHEALMHWGCAPRQCIIDNTNLARLYGTGPDAVIVPEMAAFARQYGFQFVCHAKGHSDRKAGEERSFWTTETNFLPGRTFQSLEDLNQQAWQWATVRMEHRPQGKAQLIPAKAVPLSAIILVESAIDAISCFALHPQHRCISTAGARPNPRWLVALLDQGYSVSCGFDADPTGDEMARVMIALYPSVQRFRPPQHDWNDVLKART